MSINGGSKSVGARPAANPDEAEEDRATRMINARYGGDSWLQSGTLQVHSGWMVLGRWMGSFFRSPLIRSIKLRRRCAAGRLQGDKLR